MRLSSGWLLPLLLSACVGYGDDELGSADQAISNDPCGSHYVPSGCFPTIQSAIDYVAAGSTIYLAPQTFYEYVTITKDVTIRRYGSTGIAEIQAPALRSGSTPPSALITIGMNRTLYLFDVNLRNGKGGIRNPTLIASIGDVPPKVLLTNVDINNPGVNGGVSGWMHLYANELYVKGAQADADGNGGHGIDIQGSAHFYDVQAYDNDGVGVRIKNIANPPWWYARSLDHVTASNNGKAGLVLRGHYGYSNGNNAYSITSGYFYHNSGFGLYLDDADGTVVSSTTAYQNLGDANGYWGDGIHVEKSLDVVLDGNGIYWNARAGVSVFGCSTNPSLAGLSNNGFYYNPIHLNAELSFGCDDAAMPSMLDDLGGNYCTDGPCIVLSSSLQAPLPVGP